LLGVTCALLAMTNVTNFLILCFVMVLTAAQRRHSQKLQRAKPGTTVSGFRSVEHSSPRDGPLEQAWTGGWTESPFPSCPLGTYASEDLLSPAGCVPCPRGTYASSDNLGSVEECHLCPAGTFNDRPGAKTVAECTLCPPNSWGTFPGLKNNKCSGRCPLGFYALSYGNKFEQDCEECPLGYNGGGGQCSPTAIKRSLAAQDAPAEDRAQSPEYQRLMKEKDMERTWNRDEI